jgi:hypothetical protein
MFEWTIDLSVRCTPAEAFDHVGRGFFEHHPFWDPSVTSMRKTTSGPVAPGTKGLEGRRFGPWSIVSEFEITAFEPDRRFGFQTTSGPMLEESDWTIEQGDDGSAVSIRLRLTPRSAGLRVMAPLMRPLFDRNVRRNVQRMRASLDALGNGHRTAAAMSRSAAS